MKKISLILALFFLYSCNTRYSTIPLGKVSDERKQIVTKFAETFLNKCREKDYSEFEDFNISMKLKSKIQPDSLKKSCERITANYGTVKIEKLVSVHSTNYPKDFIDVFNFKISTEKKPQIQYLHVGMYRDKNYLEVPFYFNKEENYLGYRKKKVRK